MNPFRLPRSLLAPLSLGLMLASCGNDLGAPTTLTVTVGYPATLDIHDLAFSARDETGSPAFAPFVVHVSKTFMDRGAQRVAIVLPDELEGQILLLRVDGFTDGAIRGSGGDYVSIQRYRALRAALVLTEPAVCGDGLLRAPLEACDDGDLELGDGCDPGCNIEPYFLCITPPDGPSLCAPDAARLPRASEYEPR